jgi:O-succinylhomoserine sulfhydrylase
VKAGDRVVASDALFGSCNYIVQEILPKWGVETVFVDGRDLAQWKTALAKPTKAVLLETPSNPSLRLVDLKAVCDLGHAAGAQVIVDNVFATPLLQRPLEFGADIVVYSATKHIDGQGRCLGGVILGTAKYINETLQPFIRHTGPSLSPVNAWILLKGLETLKLRVLHQSQSAKGVAETLSGLKGVTRVIYPHLDSHPQAALCRRQMGAGGTMVTFEVAGGKEKAFDVLRRLELVDISNNLGDAKSLITHPATTTHRNIGAEARAAMGITDGMLRLSVGLEDADDVIADVKQAIAG